MSTVVVNGWLTEAVQSILDQRDVSLEIIVVLDGAPVEDEPTWMRDGRVQIIRHPRRTGLANALCVASRHAQGHFLARMDADDISLPGRLSSLQQYLESNADVCVVGTAASLIDSQARIVGELRPSDGDDLRRALVGRNQLVHPSVVMRRSSYDRVGGYNAGLEQMEDYDLWLRMGLVGRVAALPDKLLLYRVHPGQMSRRAAPYGVYASAISRGQYRLGRTLGMSVLGVGSSVLAWRMAQFARYSGVLKPGYDKAAGLSPRADEK